MGETPTGKRMEVEEVFFLRAEDGKFVDYWALEDSLGRMRQLGLIPLRSVKGQGPCGLPRTPLHPTFGESPSTHSGE